jgi:hypothetical protein
MNDGDVASKQMHPLLAYRFTHKQGIEVVTIHSMITQKPQITTSNYAFDFSRPASKYTIQVSATRPCIDNIRYLSRNVTK